MLKITKLVGPETICRLRLEGKLLAPWVDVLLSACNGVCTSDSQVELDLARVSYVEDSGLIALRSLIRRGAVVIATSPFISELLKSESSAMITLTLQYSPAKKSSTLSRTSSMERVFPVVSPAEKSNGSRFTALLQQRDGKAFEKLVELGTPVLLAAAKRLLRNDEDAADMVQDTFLLVFTSIESFRGDSSIMTWVHRILINKCLMKLRSSAGKNCVSMDSIDMDARGSCPSNRLEPAAPESDCKLEAAETKAIVHKCIRQLPPDYRTIIRLRDFEQFDTDQTAVVLGITPGAVKTRLHRAHQALRVLIESVPRTVDGFSEFQRNLAPAFASNN